MYRFLAVADKADSTVLFCFFHSLQAYPQFVLTYLEELNVQVDVTQTEYHLHHGAWTADHQEHGSSLAEEVSVVSQRQDRARSLKDILKRGKMFGLFSRGKNEFTN